jgi:hypothetical protein
VRHAILCAFATLAACADSAAIPRESHEALMDRIETSISLPKRAAALDAYGRYYADLPEGRVRAIYLIPSKPLDPAAACWTGDRPCTAEERASLESDWAAAASGSLKAGERRWLGDGEAAPQIMDGGCSQITIDYEIATERFLGVVCNGRG